MKAERWSWGAAIALSVALAAPAVATEPPRRCAAKKALASGRHYQCVIAAATHPAPDFSRCDATLNRKFSAAESGADDWCPTVGDASTVAAANATHAAGVAAALGGGPAAAPRLVDNGDGTITDARTGLMWEKLSDDGSIHDRDDTYQWTTALSVKIAALNAAAFAGHTDWRLPNVNELYSIVSQHTHLRDLPTVSSAFHTGCLSGCTVTTCSCTPFEPLRSFWSSTSLHSTPSLAWSVADGGTSHPAEKAGLDHRHVRAVRGGS